MHKGRTLKGFTWACGNFSSIGIHNNYKHPHVFCAFTPTLFAETTEDELLLTLVSLFNTSACLVCSNPPRASEFCSKMGYPPREEEVRKSAAHDSEVDTRSGELSLLRPGISLVSAADRKCAKLAQNILSYIISSRKVCIFDFFSCLYCL